MRLGCCVIIRNAAGKYLLQLRDEHAPEHQLLWDFFGGGIEEGETAIECAIRELEEELELRVSADDLKILGEDEWKDHRDTAIACNKTLEWGEIRLHEGAGCGFFSISEIEKLPTVPYIPNFVRKYLQ